MSMSELWKARVITRMRSAGRNLYGMASQNGRFVDALSDYYRDNELKILSDKSTLHMTSFQQSCAELWTNVMSITITKETHDSLKKVVAEASLEALEKKR